MAAAWGLRSPHDRAIALLAIPALGSLVADPLLGLVDTAFIGRVGADALAGLGVAAALFHISFFLFNFVEYGTTAEVARAMGRDDPGAAGRATITAIRLAVILGAAVTGILLVAAGPAVAALGARGAVAAEATTYVMIRALAAPAVLLVRTAHGAYRGHQDTKTPFYVTAGINAVNLALDPLLIFGMGMGVAGAAWATVVAQWSGVVVFAALAWRGGARYGLRQARLQGPEVRVFLRIGRDLAIRTGSLLITFTAATAVATRVSSEAVAAHQVLMQLFVFLALALDAFAIAAQALVGRYLGSGDVGAARVVSDRLLVLGLGVGLLIAGILAAVSPWLGGWFTDDPQVQVAFASAIWLLVASQPIGALAFVWDGVFIGAGDFAFLAAAMALSSAVACMLLALVLPFGWGLPGVWWAMLVLLCVRVLTLAWRRASSRSPLRPA